MCPGFLHDLRANGHGANQTAIRNEMKAKAYVISIRPENWPPCDRDAVKLFGIPVRHPHPSLFPGDVFLVRRARIAACGCIGIWRLREEERVSPHTRIPWPDAIQNGGVVEYKWKQYFDEVARFRNVFSEGFGGKQGGSISEKVGVHPTYFEHSVVRIDVGLSQYVGALLEEKRLEIPNDVIVQLQVYACDPAAARSRRL
jgi:hypothetical protein